MASVSLRWRDHDRRARFGGCVFDDAPSNSAGAPRFEFTYEPETLEARLVPVHDDDTDDAAPRKRQRRKKRGVPLGHGCELHLDSTPVEGRELRVGVSTALVCPKRGALLTRRSPHLTSFPSTLLFPGGHVEPGESLEAAALRELEEEIGFTTTKTPRLVALWESKHSDDDGRLTHHHLVAYFAVDVDEDTFKLEELNLQTAEVTGVAWTELSHDDLPNVRQEYAVHDVPDEPVASADWHTTTSTLNLDSPVHRRPRRARLYEATQGTVFALAALASAPIRTQ